MRAGAAGAGVAFAGFAPLPPAPASTAAGELGGGGGGGVAPGASGSRDVCVVAFGWTVAGASADAVGAELRRLDVGSRVVAFGMRWVGRRERELTAGIDVELPRPDTTPPSTDRITDGSFSGSYWNSFCVSRIFWMSSIASAGVW